MLEVSDLSVRYGTIDAVSGLDLEVGPGDALALLGPNGAGKTSTLDAISGLVRSGGTVRYDGEDLARWNPDRIARAGLIHVPEGRHVFADLTVVENLQMGALARAGRRPSYDVDAVLDLFPPLVALRDRPGFALSGGEQQMVALGRALMGAPRVLLLDEPSLGLAPIVAQAVFAALADIRRDTPMVVVEQNTQLALGVCQSAIVLVNGRVVLSGAADELDDRSALLASYLGHADATAHREPGGDPPPDLRPGSR